MTETRKIQREVAVSVPHTRGRKGTSNDSEHQISLVIFLSLSLKEASNMLKGMCDS